MFAYVSQALLGHPVQGELDRRAKLGGLAGLGVPGRDAGVGLERPGQRGQLVRAGELVVAEHADGPARLVQAALGQLVRAVDGGSQPTVGRVGQGEQPRALELDDQPGQRVGQHVVHLAGQPLPFGQRSRPQFGVAGLLHLGQQPLAPGPAGCAQSSSPELSAVAVAFFTHANGLVVAREDGVLRRWHASPLPSWAYFAARIMATMAVTAAAGLILVLVAVAMTGVHLTAHAVLGLLIVDMLAALALAAAGTAITAIIPSAQSAQPVLMLTYIPLIVLGGTFGAITSLPHWVNTAMTYLPVQPAIDAASRALQHNGAIMSAHDLAVLAGWVVGGLLVSFRYFAWDPHRPGHARPAEARATLRSAK